MTCYHPQKVYRSKSGRNPDTGKWPISFNFKDGYHDMELEIPCGRCTGCRLDRSRKWATRCINEAQLYDKNCFLTLTYSPEYLPSDGSLKFEHFQKFMKRYRKAFGEKIRFFHAGEYGEFCKNCNQSKLKCTCKQNGLEYIPTLGRPHYHAIIFNHDFDDKIHFKTHRSQKYYISEKLSKLWPYGYHVIADVTFESCAYVARYIMKKINGDMAEKHYDGKSPEYITMSRRPGIGGKWIEKYHKDVYPKDLVIVSPKIQVKPSRFYDHYLEMIDEKTFKKIKLEREKNGILNKVEQVRLNDMEKCKEIQTKTLVRRYENDY